jgi:hypothetical protein
MGGQSVRRGRVYDATCSNSLRSEDDVRREFTVVDGVLNLDCTFLAFGIGDSAHLHTGRLQFCQWVGQQI